MEELHPRKDGTAVWKDRWTTLLVIVIVAYLFYDIGGTAVDVVRDSASSVDIAVELFRVFINLAVWIGGGAMVWGFIRGIANAYLRISDGKLEYRWRWWKWEHSKGIDLKTVSVARIDDHLSVYRGRTNAVLSIMFTRKPSTDPTNPAVALAIPEPFFPLPKGITKEEAELFLQKVNQEIKRVSGGW